MYIDLIIFYNVISKLQRQNPNANIFVFMAIRPIRISLIYVFPDIVIDLLRRRFVSLEIPLAVGASMNDRISVGDSARNHVLLRCG